MLLFGAHAPLGGRRARSSTPTQFWGQRASMALAIDNGPQGRRRHRWSYICSSARTYEGQATRGSWGVLLHLGADLRGPGGRGHGANRYVVAVRAMIGRGHVVPRRCHADRARRGHHRAETRFPRRRGIAAVVLRGAHLLARARAAVHTLGIAIGHLRAARSCGSGSASRPGALRAVYEARSGSWPGTARLLTSSPSSTAKGLRKFF